MAIIGFFFGLLLVLLIIGVPVAITLGFVSSSWILYHGANVQMVASRMYAGLNQFVIMAIPFFILAGEIMNRSGITLRIIKFVNYVVGRVRGGLAQANIYTSLLFAGITGAAISDVSALGSVFIPAMEKQGYTRKFSAMITAASSIVGPIIPPSIIVVIYGGITGTSIGALFAAAIIPGIFIGLSMSLMVALMAKKKNLPKVDVAFSVKEFSSTFKDTILALFMPIIIIGGILGGIFTPTEAAAVAVFYALIVSVFIYRTMNAPALWQCIRKAIRTSAMLFFIIGLASILGWIITRINLPQILANYFLSISEVPIVVFLLVVVLLLFIGTWLETGAACIILAPILAPMMELLGFHPIHFATVMLITLNVGLVTPPLGVCLFAAVSVGDICFEDIVSEIWPFLILFFFVILILVFVPEITMILPRYLGFIR